MDYPTQSKKVPVQMKRCLIEQCVILPDELTTNDLWGGWFHDHYNTFRKYKSIGSEITKKSLKFPFKEMLYYLHHQQSYITRTQKYCHWDYPLKLKR